MTIQEALDAVDTLHPNAGTDHEKIAWLSALDAQLQTEVLGLYEDAGIFGGYSCESRRGTVLLAPPPYDQMYLYHLQAQICYHNGEFDRCNNAARMFQSVYDSFRSHCSRTRCPKAAAIRYF